MVYIRPMSEQLIPVSDFVKTFYNRRGHAVSVSYIYRLIRQHKEGKRAELPFDYKEIGQIIFIVMYVSHPS